jgi:hypothetical protein
MVREAFHPSPAILGAVQQASERHSRHESCAGGDAKEGTLLLLDLLSPAPNSITLLTLRSHLQYSRYS